MIDATVCVVCTAPLSVQPVRLLRPVGVFFSGVGIAYALKTGAMASAVVFSLSMVFAVPVHASVTAVSNDSLDVNFLIWLANTSEMESHGFNINKLLETLEKRQDLGEVTELPEQDNRLLEAE